jgi:hypothetical protein
MITFWADAELLRTVEVARKRPPRCDRSRFIRDAIIEKLGRLGFPVDEALAEAPDRASKVIPMPEKQTARAAEEPGRYGKRRGKA